jgi:hypothetical protein
MSTATEREEWVYLSHQAGMTFKEIAQRLKVSRGRAAQIFHRHCRRAASAWGSKEEFDLEERVDLARIATPFYLPSGKCIYVMPPLLEKVLRDLARADG